MVLSADFFVPLSLSLMKPDEAGSRNYCMSNAITLVYRGEEQYPVEASRVVSDVQVTASLDWMLAARAALPNSTPLTGAERASVNEFFWSQFV